MRSKCLISIAKSEFIQHEVTESGLSLKLSAHIRVAAGVWLLIEGLATHSRFKLMLNRLCGSTLMDLLLHRYTTVLMELASIGTVLTAASYGALSKFNEGTCGERR